MKATSIGLQPWKPHSLRAPILVAVILVSALLTAFLGLLLRQSQANDGILFAPNVNDLPLKRSFAYLYLPTIVAILYGIVWSWIDLDVKRLEPFYQLSKEKGALGRDSLLLHYPFDFIATVPLKSIKRRHWPVFWASTAVVFVFWALTPLQAGIFATETITKISKEQMLVSKSFMPLSQQHSEITANYTYSVYGIIWLNEPLPPFMSRDYALAPFRMLSEAVEAQSETWTTKTSLYSLDMRCEDAHWNKTDTSHYTSSTGCEVRLPFGPSGNDTLGPDVTGTEVKEFSAMWAGFNNHDGYADYYLSMHCPPAANHTFLSAFVHNKNLANDTPESPTVLFCQPSYYVQEVEATVRLPAMSVVEVSPLGAKLPFPENIFNTSEFEWQLTSATQMHHVRGKIPAARWPDVRKKLSAFEITQGLSMPSDIMISLLLGAKPLPLEDHLNPEILQQSWESAYRLMFARSLADVLSLTFNESDSRQGERRCHTQAVVLVPIFVYVVQGLLVTATLLAVALLSLSLSRSRMLRSDPATIAAVMSMVAENSPLLEKLICLDSSPDEDIRRALQNERFILASDGRLRMLTQESPPGITRNGNAPVSQTVHTWKGIHPLEYRLYTFLAFLIANSALVVVLIGLYIKAIPDGLKLPTSNRFVRQLLENYLPTALATFIEPVWVVVNRLFCLLQPYEALRDGKARPSKSINLDYASLPPQLVFWRALRARHATLASLCGMAMLANVLAIAFSGLLNENTIGVPYPERFSQPFQPVIYNTSFAVLESASAYTTPEIPLGGLDQSYIAMSNLTSGTTLPPWTDKGHFYLPFSAPSLPKDRFQRSASTQAFGVQLNCMPLPLAVAQGGTLSMQLDGDTGFQCRINDTSLNFQIGTGNDFRYDNCSNLPQANEFLRLASPPPDATDMEREKCPEYMVAGWTRTPGQDHCISNTTIADDDATIVVCRPTLLTGTVDVRVDTSGVVQEAKPTNLNSDFVEQYFDRGTSDFISKLNRFFVGNARLMVQGGGWHNDSYPSDFINFFMTEISGNTRLLDPSVPPLSFNKGAALLGDVYSRLFAVMFGSQFQHLLKPSADPDKAIVKGYIIRPETRVFISKPLFIASIAILSTYIIMSIIVYIRRPGRFLPRFPTTIASVIAMSAASHAIQDLKDTAHMSGEARRKHLDSLDHRYGYGAFVGTDGKVHIGIERQPYLGLVKKSGMRDSAENSDDEKGNLLLRQATWKRVLGWKDGKVREGGWI